MCLCFLRYLCGESSELLRSLDSLRSLDARQRSEARKIDISSGDDRHNFLVTARRERLG
jgi:hypothetical protein